MFCGGILEDLWDDPTLLNFIWALPALVLYFYLFLFVFVCAFFKWIVFAAMFLLALAIPPTLVLVVFRSWISNGEQTNHLTMAAVADAFHTQMKRV